jgi:hypothetical protein
MWVLSSLHDLSPGELLVQVMASATGPLAFDSSVKDMTMMHLERPPDFHEEQDTMTMIVGVRLHWKVCCLCCPS